MPITLEDLLRRCPQVTASVSGDAHRLLSGVESDSRAVRPGDLFCCLVGEHVDGHDFAASAREAGAAALVVTHELDIDLPQVIVADTRHAVGYLAAAYHAQPCEQMTVVAVTGTNGKTTTAAMIAAVIEADGRPTGVIGTLTGVHTTPEAVELQRRLGAFRDAGTEAVVMEVSSHALALERVNGCHFALSVFTNLGRDHLDFHGSLERYFAAKASLFSPELSVRGLSNGDDVHGRLLADAASIPMHTWSREDATEVTVGLDHLEFTWRGRRVQMPIGGEFNLDNALAAASACAELGIDDDTIVRGLAALAPVPGRFERVASVRGAEVVVDFAHTPEGLERVVVAARALVPDGRVTVVFGAGGDRDRSKRAPMGRAASGADVIIVTTDNPRSEDPQLIADEIVAGVVSEARGRVHIELDRRAAIREALTRAAPGDVVVVAGKGHELTQTVGTTTTAFDDRAVVREAARELEGSARPGEEPVSAPGAATARDRRGDA